VPIGVITAAGAVAGFVFLILTAIFGVMKSSTPYQEALARATANPQLITVLGTPIKEGFMMSGQFHTSGSSGSASLEIPISGPNNRAVIYVEARKSAGAWTYTTLEAAIPGQAERIELKP
jgi:Cytochrome oxidase complex assembly protein 1